jgi:hypothetical protein
MTDSMGQVTKDTVGSSAICNYKERFMQYHKAIDDDIREKVDIDFDL